MKIEDQRETQKTKKNKDGKEQGGNRNYSEGWELNDFIVHLS